MLLTDFYFFNIILLSSEFFLMFNILFFLIFISTYNKIYLTFLTLQRLTLFSLFMLFLINFYSPFTYELAFNALFLLKQNICIIKSIIILILIFFLLFNTKQYLYNIKYLAEYFVLLKITILSSFFILISYNFISLFLTIELQGLTFYILVCLYNNNIYSIEASIKYLILGALNTSVFLLGVSFIYGYTGTLCFDNLSLFCEFINITNIFSNFLGFGIILLLISFIFKMGIAPFHTWLVDIYEGAPTTIAMFFAIIPKFVILILIINLFIIFNIKYTTIQFFFIFLASCSLLVGTVSTIIQYRYKRFLAFSSITHNGFLLSCLLILSIEHLQFLLFYNLIYILMTFILWSFILMYKNTKYCNLKYLTDLNNVFFLNKTFSIIFVIVFFSLMGIPPFIGFFTKFGIIFILFLYNNNIFAFFIFIISCLSSYYYLKIIKLVFHDKKKIYNSLFIIKKTQSLIISFLTCFLFFGTYKLNYILLFCKILSLNFFL